MKTIEYLADRFWRRGACKSVERQELVDVAVMEVMRARSRFDPAKSKWITFASFRARGAMQDELRKQDHVSRYYRRRARQGGEQVPELVSFDAAGTDRVDGRDPGPLLRAAGEDLWRELDRILGPRSAEILRRYYRRDQNLREIGVELGFSESLICQLHARAIRKLRLIMKEHKS